MPSARKVVSIFFFVVLFVVQNSECKKFEINKFIEEHGTCNGETPTLPLDWVPNALAAAAKCLDITDEFCAKLCLAYNYDGFIVNNKLDTKWLKGKANDLGVSKANEKSKDAIVAAVDGCAKPNPAYTRPTAKTESCPEWEKFDVCMDEAFKVACKGKKGKGSDDFLN
ncbi:uncharacterized protein LOC110853435 [Folsomia candida]|uniref:uncharacterized protein LOC110862952 n=1 Tax=Folsomia candida TaxID=158441 RepID=UPI000B8FA9D3|nr:uncharacterized protein LOC110862952 [Folsomia candida]XP_035710118.1 uncharacterized protein LOC110853435 [Folsomia candida]